jgi:hypothetical protein
MRVTLGSMKSKFSKYLAELGRRGGQARVKSTTAAQRRKIALKAAKASADARRQKAKKKA